MERKHTRSNAKNHKICFNSCTFFIQVFIKFIPNLRKLVKPFPCYYCSTYTFDKKNIRKFFATFCSRSTHHIKLEEPNYQLATGRKSLYELRCRDFVAVWKHIRHNNYIFEVELLEHFLHLGKFSRAARKAFAGHMRPAGHTLCNVQACFVAILKWVSDSAGKTYFPWKYYPFPKRLFARVHHSYKCWPMNKNE